uniref:Uncharacterized protein n=1 Tax=Arundo donax TaxID=35708 RepID=A0A0A9AQI7_ARUDO
MARRQVALRTPVEEEADLTSSPWEPLHAGEEDEARPDPGWLAQLPCEPAGRAHEATAIGEAMVFSAQEEGESTGVVVGGGQRRRFTRHRRSTQWLGGEQV